MYSLLVLLGIVGMGQVGTAGERYGQPAAENGSFDHSDSQPPARSLQSPPPATPGSKPSELYRKLLSPPINNRLPGSKIGLAEVVRGANSRGQQTRRVEAYWDLTAAVTDYHLSLLELTEFDVLRASVSQPSQRWQQAKQLFAGRVHVSEHSAMAAQYRLLSLMGRSNTSSNRLPLPGDLPHCGAYDTRYDQIFGNRVGNRGNQPSRYAQELHNLLPQRHQDLRRQAAGVATARDWLDRVSDHRGQQDDGTGLLKSHELLILRRRAFVYTVRDYNLQIARYSELASPGNVGSDRLVAMLIRVATKRPGRWNSSSSSSSSGIERTSAVEELRASDRRPRTFVPDSDDSKRTRSLLVHP